MRSRARRFFRREPLLCSACLLLAAYVASYIHLARRGSAWCEPLGFYGFLYVLPHDSPRWYGLHQAARVFYAPANEIDRSLCTGRYPVRAITFGLSR